MLSPNNDQACRTSSTAPSICATSTAAAKISALNFRSWVLVGSGSTAARMRLCFSGASGVISQTARGHLRRRCLSVASKTRPPLSAPAAVLITRSCPPRRTSRMVTRKGVPWRCTVRAITPASSATRPSSLSSDSRFSRIAASTSFSVDGGMIALGSSGSRSETCSRVSSASSAEASLMARESAGRASWSSITTTSGRAIRFIVKFLDLTRSLS